jgi:CDP-diacylglycerol---serine O-phosphatidyltransferase
LDKVKKRVTFAAMLNLPNFLTMLNLFCGCCAIVSLMSFQADVAAWFTLGSFVCDYADGMVARAMKISSPIGRELDSLADVVSFGVVPGMMLFMWLGDKGNNEYRPEALFAFVLSAFSALRLAKFNVDTRQKNFFYGLSTPACTLLVLGLTLAGYSNQYGLGDFLKSNSWIIYLIIPILSALLISDIPMFGMKIRSSHIQKNKVTLSFMLMCVVMLFTLKYVGLMLSVLVYIVLSVIFKNKIIDSKPTN